MTDTTLPADLHDCAVAIQARMAATGRFMVLDAAQIQHVLELYHHERAVRVDAQAAAALAAAKAKAAADAAAAQAAKDAEAAAAAASAAKPTEDELAKAAAEVQAAAEHLAQVQAKVALQGTVAPAHT